MTAIDDKIKELEEKRKKLREKYNEVSNKIWSLTAMRGDKAKELDKRRSYISKEITQLAKEIANLNARKTNEKPPYTLDRASEITSQKKNQLVRNEMLAKEAASRYQEGLPRHDPLKDKEPPGYIDNKTKAGPGGLIVPDGKPSGPPSGKPIASN